jgi:hypothetical protein
VVRHRLVGEAPGRRIDSNEPGFRTIGHGMGEDDLPSGGIPVLRGGCPVGGSERALRNVAARLEAEPETIARGCLGRDRELLCLARQQRPPQLFVM